jgi:hypothetical protein
MGNEQLIAQHICMQSLQTSKLRRCILLVDVKGTNHSRPQKIVGY